jgi:hypothetical protein
MSDNRVVLRVRKIDGSIIQTKGIITEWIDHFGSQFSTACVCDKTYEVVDRDYYGPIFGKKKLD